jgi:adenylosuccinate lyase
LGQPNDLLKRLAGEPAMAGIDLNAVLDPHQYVGRAPEQVQQCVSQVVEPIRGKYQSYLRQQINLCV